MRPQTKEGLRFTGLFLIYWAVCNSITMTDTIGQAVMDLTFWATVSVYKLFGTPLTTEGPIICLTGAKMYINLECTAVHLYVIFIAAVLAYPRSTWINRAKGLFAGLVILFVSNILRILALGQVLVYYRDAFDVMHQVVFQAAMVLLVFLCWYVWVNGLIRLRVMGRMLAGAALSALLVQVVLGQYLKLLAFITSLAIHGLEISAVDDSILYTIGEATAQFPINVDIYDSIIFFALMAAFPPKVDISKRWGLGVAALVGIHLLIVITGGLMVRHGIDGDLRQYLMWIIRGMSLISTIILWGFVRGVGRGIPSTPPVDLVD